MSVNINPSSAPHFTGKSSISGAMRDVVIALIPIFAVSVYYYGVSAIILTSTSLAAAALTEFFIRKLRGKEQTLHDGSALVTGALVAISLPAQTYWWVAVLATIIAVGLVKELSGGLGLNRLNPALAGRVSVTVLSWLFLELSPAVDAVSQATPLARLTQGLSLPGYWEMFAGVSAGAMAETSALAVLAGGLYLLYKRHIDWRMPCSVLATVFVLSLLRGQDPVYHLLSGGLMLGSFFMATDWVTSPISGKGKLVGGGLVGALVVLFRALPFTTEGVAFAILLMNLSVPAIDELTRSRTFGHSQISGLMQVTRVFSRDA